MISRETVIDFTRGVMDRLRAECGIGDEPCQLERVADGWDWHAPSGRVSEFRYMFSHPHKGYRKLGYRERPRDTLAEIAWVRNDAEACHAIELFLRGIR